MRVNRRTHQHVGQGVERGQSERALRDAGLTPTWLQDRIGRGLWTGVRG